MEYDDSEPVELSISDIKALEDRERAVLATDVIEAAESAVASLRIQKEPSAQRDTLYFELDELNAVLPPSLLGNLAGGTTLENAIITFDHNLDDKKGSISVRFDLAKETADMLSVAVELIPSVEHDMYVALMHIEGEDSPIALFDLVPRTELNVFFASIFSRSKTGKYDAFKQIPHNELEVLRRLLDALSEHTDDHMSESTYIEGWADDEKTIPINPIQVNEDCGQTIRIQAENSKAPQRRVMTIEFDQEGKPYSEGDELDPNSIDGIRIYEPSNDPNIEHTAERPSTEHLVEFLDFFNGIAPMSETESEIPAGAMLDLPDSQTMNIEDSRELSPEEDSTLE